MIRFLLIRHALTDAVGRLFAGRLPGIHLNETGREQARRLAGGLESVQLTAIVSSPLERALETAAPIAVLHDLEVEVNAALTEIDIGEWTGREFKALDSTSEWQLYNRMRSLTTAPAGESLLDVQHRAMTAILALRGRFENGTIAVVSHGDVIRAILLHCLGMPIDCLDRFEVSPARISIVDLSEGSARVIQVNGDNANAIG
ncbi:MAG: hypothetical protein C5B57_07835 [Blastocatellia bacterium]|nr:MAG: hypothetical protein C5B57_07835 [Blastocatellia bacterium]